MTLRRGLALLSTHCSFTPSQLNEFSYIEYKDCIRELGLKLNYSAISHILGNSNVGEDIMKTVNEANPFNYKEVIKPIHNRMTKEMALALVGGQK